MRVRVDDQWHVCVIVGAGVSAAALQWLSIMSAVTEVPAGSVYVHVCVCVYVCVGG